MQPARRSRSPHQARRRSREPQLDHQTPLHLAAYCGSHETVNKLIVNGANVHARDESGETPLHLAAVSNCTKSIDHLLQAGADPKAEVPGKIGTPLEYAQGFGSTAAVDRLTQAQDARENAVHSIGKRLFRHVADRIPKPNNDQQSRIIHNPDEHHHRKENSMAQEHWSNSKSARDHTQELPPASLGRSKKAPPRFRKATTNPKVQTCNPSILQRQALQGSQLDPVEVRRSGEKLQRSPLDELPHRQPHRSENPQGRARNPRRVPALPAEGESLPGKTGCRQGRSQRAAGGEKEKEAPKISHHTYVVFNAEQIERMPSLEQQLPKEPQQHEICERAERMIADSNVKIETPKNGHDYSNYDKQRDSIELPNIEKFKSPEQYYGHAASEMASRAAHESKRTVPSRRAKPSSSPPTRAAKCAVKWRPTRSARR